MLTDEGAALELTRRVAASDVGAETLSQLEAGFDDLATAYQVTRPNVMLARLREQLSYVSALMDARKTLDEHRRLVVVGAWLSLLTATVHIDLKQTAAASARLNTAASLARHAGHDEIRAWCFETEAWRLLVDGDYARALDLSRAAQELAPAGSSIAIQATAQKAEPGRASVKRGRRTQPSLVWTSWFRHSSGRTDPSTTTVTTRTNRSPTWVPPWPGSATQPPRPTPAS